MGSSDLEEAEYSAFWLRCIVMHISTVFAYLLIFWVMYFYQFKKQSDVTPKDRLLISTNLISTIHGVIVIIGAIVAFIYDELYKVENMVLSSPGILAYVWVLWNSYMLADASSHIILYCWYSPEQIKRRYDIVVHHVVSYVVAPVMQIPVPIYGWFVLLWPPITETSSVFLNMQWYGKYYKWSYQKEKRIKLCFYVTWFAVRLPALWTQIVWIIVFWNDILLWPLHSWITGICVTVIINLLHVVWSFFIVKGVCIQKRLNESQMSDVLDARGADKDGQTDIGPISKPAGHVHGVSLEFTL